MMRRTFLSHFCLCLAVAAGAAFAQFHGAFATVWHDDQSYMTSVIGLVFLAVLARLGAEAWKADDRATVDIHLGYWAAELCLIIGVIGMVGGLKEQGAAIAATGAAVFGAWAQQLSATLVGCIACAVLMVAAYNIERGARS